MKIISTTGATACSFNGQSYEADDNGEFELPDTAEGHEALTALRGHGFTEAPIDPKKVRAEAKAKADADAKEKAEAEKK